MADLLGAHSEMVITNERYIRVAEPGRYRQLGYDAFRAERLLHPVPEETQNFQWANHGPAHQALIRKYATARVVGDKVPMYHHYLDHLFSEMGKARLVFMIRNAVDVVDSWQARRDDAADRVWTADYRMGVAMWNRDNRLILEALKTYRQRIRVVSYERLYSYAPAYLGRVLGFVGVNPRDPAILEAYASMTGDWMHRFSKPSRLTPSQRDWALAMADMDLYRQVIDMGEV
jgi:hypothetical protein